MESSTVTPSGQTEQTATAPPSRPQRPDKPEPEPREGGELIAAAAKGQKLTEPEKVDALEWFLSDSAESFTHIIELNVGNPKKPKWIEWEVKPVDLDTLRRIRKQAASKQQGRRGAAGELDEVEANLRIVVEATVEPDIRAVAKQKGMVDPADALRIQFRHKPGLLGQIAGEIMSISGYDDEDVREVEAAGNS
jgi:hypothetical protein